MLVHDRFAATTSRLPILPSTPGALAAELAALLERLGIEAVVLDGQGRALAHTGAARAAFSGADTCGMRQVEARVCGQRLHIALAAVRIGSGTLDLTPRQRAVAALVAEGLRNREIAVRLGISLHTVRRHVEALLRRLNVPTRAAVASLLHREGRWCRE